MYLFLARVKNYYLLTVAPRFARTLRVLVRSCRACTVMECAIQLARTWTTWRTFWERWTDVELMAIHSGVCRRSSQRTNMQVSGPLALYAYMVGRKSKLLILSEYVNKTEKVGGMWTSTNSYREMKHILCDIFTWNILRHSCFMFKYSMTESKQWNYC